MYMLILNFTYPLRCRRVPPVEYHCTRRHPIFILFNLLYYIVVHFMWVSKKEIVYLPVCPPSAVNSARIKGPILKQVYMLDSQHFEGHFHSRLSSFICKSHLP